MTRKKTKIKICDECLLTGRKVCDACRAKAINDALCKRCRPRLADTLNALADLDEAQTTMRL